MPKSVLRWEFASVYIQYEFMQKARNTKLMICLKLPKSSEFAKKNYTNSGQKSLTMFISSCCNNYLIC